MDGDARYRYQPPQTHEARLHVLGLLARKTFADEKGDRFTISGLLEAHDNFSETSLHELWARYKGPLGKWNITAGRFGLPYGLNYSFDDSRLLYQTVEKQTLGIDADNGGMVSGVVGRIDYALSVTQGYGAHHLPGFPGRGLAAGRLGCALGDFEEMSIGVSGAYGTVSTHENRDSAISRALGGIDATAYAGRALLRAELNAGSIDNELFGAAFAGADYAIAPKIGLTLSGTAVRKERDWRTTAFAGVSFSPRWLTIRGGYTYAFQGNNRHTIALQLYRLFNYTF